MNSCRPRSPVPAKPVLVRLKRCDLRECEALCCHDGAYLERDDERRIAAARAAYPEFFRHLPAAAIVEENWRGLGAGRKTATRPWSYRRSIPAHFPATRCVFADDAGFCSLESAARAQGLHPWLFKPRTCFLFPLLDDDPAAGPAAPGEDPFDLGDDYPGFATCVDCGRHRADGWPWRQLLRAERAMLGTPVDGYFAAWKKEHGQPRDRATRGTSRSESRRGSRT